MKKLLLTAAVAATTSVAAQAAPTVYGKAYLTFDVNENETKHTTVTTTATSTTTTKGSSSVKGRTQLNSNGSRIGFKGSEAISDNTDVIYKLEYRIDVDADKSSNFKSRDTYVGLSNKQFGTIQAGRMSAIDGMVDYANVTTGGVLGGGGIQASFDSPRSNNAIAYVSPSFGGAKVMGMYLMDEGGPTERDAFGVGVQYEPEEIPFKAGVSYIQRGDRKISRVSGAFDATSSISIGALYQNDTIAKGSEKENAIAVSGSYTFAPWTAYTQVDLVDNIDGKKDAERQRLVLGGKYNFNKATTGHIYGAYLRDKDTTTTTNAAGSSVTKRTADGIGIGAGLEYKF